MALADLKKIVLFARLPDQARVVEVVQVSGVVHLTPGDVFLPDEARAFFSDPSDADDEEADAGLEKRLFVLQTVIHALETYEPRKGLAARLVPSPAYTDLQAFNALADYDETPVVRRFDELASRAHDLEEERRRLSEARASLEAVRDVPEPLETYRDTARCFVAMLRARRSGWDERAAAVTALLGDAGVCYVLTASNEHVVACVAGRRAQRYLLAEWVDAQPVDWLDVSGFEGTAAENAERLRRAEEEVCRQAEEVAGQRQALAEHLPRLRQAYDYWHTRLAQQQTWGLLRESRYTALMSGWARAEEIARLETLFVAHGLDVCLWVQDPESEDEPPVAYDNRPLARPFEFISDLYSRPRPTEVDPTPYLGVFFTLFFGICLTDAGYGLVLTLAAFLALRRLPLLSSASRKLLRILLFSGLATTGIGFLTGGFFGVSFEALPVPFNRLHAAVLLNPMTHQMEFLALTLALGVVQVAFGIFLKLRWNLRHRRFAAAWLDEAPWLVIIGGVLLLVAAYAFGAPWLRPLGYGALLLAAVVILCFAGRAAANPLKRLAAGLFSLYQVSGLFGDVLSYVRLFALGLATGVIASVVNFSAELTLGIPYLGVVVMILVLVFGHAVNIGINALGGFVHTTRLQFVEFFGKFYAGGGVPFDPFRLKLTYTHVLDLE